MAEKPKKKRDLRARLGRTITPKTKGGPAAPVAPPNIGGAPPASGGAPAPVAPPSSVTPPPAIGRPGGGVPGMPGSVTPPPFGAPPVAPPPGGDPFAAPAPQEQATVKLEFDDQLVTDKEMGRGRVFSYVLIGLVTMAAGVGVGFAVGSTLKENTIHEQTVRDARTIEREVRESSAGVDQARRHLNAAHEAASGAGGNPPEINYEAIEALRSIELPISADILANNNYKALGQGVTSNLMTYLHQVQMLWADFEALNGMIAQSHREELDASVGQTSEVLGNQLFGISLRRDENQRLMGALGFLYIDPEAAEGQQVTFRLARNGPAFHPGIYAGSGSEEIPTQGEPTQVLMVSGPDSVGVLREQTGPFGRLLAQLLRTKALMDNTSELAERLNADLRNMVQEVCPGGHGPGCDD